ncbi:hypothetical protein H6G45_00690 [Synechocystis sp. FACHB-383]|jgi:hypothetical protein|uniref:hypothetical protein n=1 Tax=unclassified Synechocystis TaxID=2640012 RepID=UPI001689585C|nr:MULTISPECIES: hypothetical protein [unclassified Synechocystis]MBD2652030.1 hypothetical protein [Synechocystis sp. FACHB-383]MBE9194018.1 hypothetical protein [Synechocystis sp. LEGE 06083]
MENLACIVLIKEEATKTAIGTTAPATNLSTLGVRALYKLASQAGVKKVKSMTKSQLIQALGGLEPATMATA